MLGSCKHARARGEAMARLRRHRARAMEPGRAGGQRQIGERQRHAQESAWMPNTRRCEHGSAQSAIGKALTLRDSFRAMGAWAAMMAELFNQPKRSTASPTGLLPKSSPAPMCTRCCQRLARRGLLFGQCYVCLRLQIRPTVWSSAQRRREMCSFHAGCILRMSMHNIARFHAACRSDRLRTAARPYANAGIHVGMSGITRSRQAWRTSLAWGATIGMSKCLPPSLHRLDLHLPAVARLRAPRRGPPTQARAFRSVDYQKRLWVCSSAAKTFRPKKNTPVGSKVRLAKVM